MRSIDTLMYVSREGHERIASCESLTIVGRVNLFRTIDMIGRLAGVAPRTTETIKIKGIAAMEGAILRRGRHDWQNRLLCPLILGGIRKMHSRDSTSPIIRPNFAIEQNPMASLRCNQ